MKSLTLTTLLLDNIPLVFLVLLSTFDFVKSEVIDFTKKKNNFLTLCQDFIGILGLHGMLLYLVLMAGVGTRAWHSIALENIKTVPLLVIQILEFLATALMYKWMRKAILKEMGNEKVTKGKIFVNAFVNIFSMLGGVLGYITILLILLLINKLIS